MQINFLGFSKFVAASPACPEPGRYASNHQFYFEGHKKMRFSLRKNEWYACEFIGDEFDEDKCSYSPIRILDIKTLNSGKREYLLNFYHANYPEGVRDKEYKLRTIERGKTYLLAKAIDYSPPRFLQIYNINNNWLERHFGCELDKRIDCKEWLNRHA